MARRLRGTPRESRCLLGGACCRSAGAARRAGSPPGLYQYFAPPRRDDAWSAEDPRLAGARARGVSAADHVGASRASRRIPARASATCAPSTTSSASSSGARSRATSRTGSRTRRATTTSPTARSTTGRRSRRPSAPTATTATVSSCSTFHFLRELGFPEDQVFRAIVVRPHRRPAPHGDALVRGPERSLGDRSDRRDDDRHAAHVGDARLGAAQGVQRTAATSRYAFATPLRGAADPARLVVLVDLVLAHGLELELLALLVGLLAWPSARSLLDLELELAPHLLGALLLGGQRRRFRSRRHSSSSRLRRAASSFGHRRRLRVRLEAHVELAAARSRAVVGAARRTRSRFVPVLEVDEAGPGAVGGGAEVARGLLRRAVLERPRSRGSRSSPPRPTLTRSPGWRTGVK